MCRYPNDPPPGRPASEGLSGSDRRGGVGSVLVLDEAPVQAVPGTSCAVSTGRRVVHSRGCSAPPPCTALWTKSVDNGDGTLGAMSTTATLITAEEAVRELPIPPWLIGVIALIAFVFLLGVTWSFRGTHNKYARPQYGDGTPAGSQTATGHDGTPDAEAHWPEHPGHH